MSDRLDWDGARSLAARAVPPSPATALPLADARGAVLVADATAPGPVPHYDSSAMDGWVVRGAAPWRIVPRDAPLDVGRAAAVVTGGLVPAEADGVVPAEAGAVADGVLTAAPPAPGAHVRRAGEEAAAGAVLVPAGARLSPAHLAMLGVAGLDEVLARPAPTVAAVLTGDEVVETGMPAPGHVRDAFGLLIPAAIAGLGARPAGTTRCGDDPDAIAAAVRDASSDVVVTVGGTGRSGADRLREALAGCGARILVEGVSMRPGHPALLALLGDGRPLLALPGNPLAAVVVLLSFLPPLLAGLAGASLPALPSAPAAADLRGWPGGTSLLPARHAAPGLLPVAAARPNMLRGLASADALAVVPAGGASAGTPTRFLALPW